MSDCSFHYSSCSPVILHSVVQLFSPHLPGLVNPVEQKRVINAAYNSILTLPPEGNDRHNFLSPARDVMAQRSCGDRAGRGCNFHPIPS